MAESKEVYVCTHCGSANLLWDAFVHANNPNDVRTFDDCYCENCEGSCSVNRVTVPADFNEYTDIYKEKS